MDQDLLATAFDALRSRSNDPGWSSAEVEVTMVTGLVPVSRELGIEMGVIEPTAAERAELEREAVSANLAAAEHTARMRSFRRRLAAVTEQPARAVLDLHAEDDRSCCEGCDVDGYESWQPDWPCRTIEGIAKHYGIETP